MGASAISGTKRTKASAVAGAPRAGTAAAPATKDSLRSLGLRRGLEILCLFTDDCPEWGVTEISRTIGIHKSRVHRAIKTLEDMGFVRRNPMTRKYLMGTRAFVVGSVAGRLTNSVPEARRVLRQLSDQIGATVSLRMIDGDGLLVIDCYEGFDHLPSHWPVGTRVPFNFGAGGKVFAAHRSPAELAGLIETFGLPRYTQHTITDPQAYLDEIDRVRRQGYATSDSENIPGSFSAAAPVLDRDGRLIAVIVASRPARQITAGKRGRFIEVVVEAAREISEMAGRRSEASEAGRKGARSLAV